MPQGPLLVNVATHLYICKEIPGLTLAHRLLGTGTDPASPIVVLNSLSLHISGICHAVDCMNVPAYAVGDKRC